MNPVSDKRLCKDWINSYLELTKTQESPPLFHYASALFAISSALGRKCYLSRGFYRLYPNLYIIIVAGSATCRKSAAIGIGESLLLQSNPDCPLTAQKLSPEALLQFLSENFKLNYRSEAIIVAEELGVFLGSGQTNMDLIQLLTKLYNCQDKMTYRTIGRGKEVCENTHCCFLGGTTPEWMRTSLPRTAIEGGFTGRFLFIYQSSSLQKVFEPVLNKDLWEELALDLSRIWSMEGTFIYSAEALAFMTDWYENKFEPEEGDVKMDGYYGRKHDTALKLGMIFSASRGPSLKVEKKDLVAALAFLSEIEKHMSACFKAFQTTDYGDALRSVRKVLIRAKEKGISRTDLLRKLSYKFSAADLDAIMHNLLEMQLVRMEKTQGSSGPLRKTYYAIGDF